MPGSGAMVARAVQALAIVSRKRLEFTAEEFRGELEISKPQAYQWLYALEENGIVERTRKVHGPRETSGRGTGTWLWRSCRRLSGRE